jgi:hypothetical protein
MLLLLLLLRGFLTCNRKRAADVSILANWIDGDM